MNVFPKIGKDLTLSQEIEKKIEKAIINKKFLPGEKLPTENEMCEMFSVSRTSLREALQKLSTRGLIKIKKGSGIYVEEVNSSYAVNSMGLFLQLNLNKKYISYIIETRKILEPNIAKLAAQHRTENDLEQMKKSLVDLKNCDLSNYEKQGLIDRNFHLLIANSTSNPMIPVIVEPIFNIMPKIRMLVYEKVEQAHDTALIFHTEIVKQIEAKDADAAFNAMKMHLKIADEHSKIISNKLD